MANAEKSNKSGFVIKLSSETAQKLAEYEQNRSKDDEENTSTTSSEATLDKQDNLTIQGSTKEEPDDRLSSTKQGGDVQLESLLKSPTTTDEVAGADEKVKPSDQCTENSWGEYAPYMTYEGEVAVYTDPSTQHKYTWNKSSNSWEPRAADADTSVRQLSYEDDTHIYTETDGSKFFWDENKKAWIPKIDDDFLAFYQMSYGFVDNTAKEEDKPKSAKKKDTENKAEQSTGVKRKNDPQWFEPSEESNTKVYVSNLPQELTEEEFVNLMQKCGLVERDPFSQKMKVKLYYDKDNNVFKGDALCTYIKIESVDLALKLLDGSDFKGNTIKVERAHFQLKGEYNPALKPKKKKKKEIEKLKKMQQKLFDWRPEKFIGERSKHERVVIVKNLFHPSDFDQEVQLILDYQQDLREECGKCGDVRKVTIYDRHPEGVAQISMKEPEQADAVVQLINGRWFGKRQITAEIWDGRTKYRIGETDADISKRIDKWDKFLEGKEDNKEATPETSTNKSTSKESDTAEPVVEPEPAEPGTT